MRSVKKEGKKRDKELREDLLEIMQRAARDTDLLDAFLCDILTPREYRDIARRLQIVKELKKGISHREIAKNLGVGVATIERGVRVIENKSGGMNRLL
ncbi:MAG: Trp family transcriptional regulator [Nanoarchaeota archaeon]|nr:Trp family transcriptional regulator [Nanoarchaeota archaeon]